MNNPHVKVITAADGLNPNTFIPLPMSYPCTAYLLKNTGPDTLVMRTDPNDATTEDTLVAGGQEGISISFPLFGVYRYNIGDILYYVKCTGPLVLKCWR